jgi:hypothetical protein
MAVEVQHPLDSIGVSALRTKLMATMSPAWMPEFSSERLAAGALDVDVRLCRASSEANDTIGALRANAEAGFLSIADRRASLHAAVDARMDALDSLLAAELSAKVAALERQLINIDAALDRFRADQRAFSDAALLSDSALAAAGPALLARVDELVERLRAVHTVPVVLPAIGVEFDTTFEAALGMHGAVFAPPTVFATDVVGSIADAGAVPDSDAEALTLSLGSAYPSQNTLAGTASALISLASELRVDAVSVSPTAAVRTPTAQSGSSLLIGETTVQLMTSLSMNQAASNLSVNLKVPRDASPESKYYITRIAVAGKPLIGSLVFPIRVLVGAAKRCWRVLITESSATGWECYMSNLRFLGPGCVLGA